jgi:Protein of unknown function (DUF3352)
MKTVRAFFGVFVATFVLAAAGCGSSDVGAGGPSAATQLKPGALVYWETESDPGSDQWQQTEDLLRRFPDGDRLIAELRKLVTEQGVDWEQDVKPALGETTALAVYAKSGAEAPNVVGLTNPSDPDKTIALMKKLDAKEGGDPSVTRVVGDWVVISDKEAAIDAALKTSGGEALADDQSFTSAMNELPDDALTRFYADPAGALDAFGGSDPDTTSALKALGLDRLDFAGAWAKAKDKGAELAFILSGEGAARVLGTGEPYASALLERVPEDAFAFLSFQGRAATRQLEQLKSNPLYAMGLQQFERELGVKLDDLLALFDGEVAFYARPSAPIPELTLLLESDDVQQARASADNLLRAVARRSGVEVTESGGVTTANFGGFTVNLGTVESAVVLTTSQRGLADLEGSGGKLPDSDRYKAALETAGVPDEYTGLTYVDLAETIELVLGYMNFAGESEQLSPEVARNLEPLKSLVAWGTLDGEVASALAFVEID